jgi:hypothetical protein
MGYAVVGLLWTSYFTSRIKLHGQGAPRLRRLVRRGWTRLPLHSSWLPGAEVDDDWDGY